MYGKIIDLSEKKTAEVNERSHDFVSSSSNYLKTSTTIVTKDNLKQNSCQVCSLLISIFSKEEVGNLVDFSI